MHLSEATGADRGFGSFPGAMAMRTGLRAATANDPLLDEMNQALGNPDESVSLALVANGGDESITHLIDFRQDG